MFHAAAFAVLALAQQVPVAVPPAAAAAAKETPAEGERKICRRVSQTGSNVLAKKVCLTAAQWDATARQGQQLARDMQPAWTTPNQ